MSTVQKFRAMGSRVFLWGIEDVANDVFKYGRGQCRLHMAIGMHRAEGGFVMRNAASTVGTGEGARWVRRMTK